jgi:hypothetical protein
MIVAVYDAAITRIHIAGGRTWSIIIGFADKCGMTVDGDYSPADDLPPKL